MIRKSQLNCSSAEEVQIPKIYLYSYYCVFIFVFEITIRVQMRFKLQRFRRYMFHMLRATAFKEDPWSRSRLRIFNQDMYQGMLHMVLLNAHRNTNTQRCTENINYGTYLGMCLGMLYMLLLLGMHNYKYT